MGSLELSLVDAEPELFRHQTSQIDRETVRVVESPDVLSVELLLPGLECLLRVLLEQLLTTIKRTGEGFLLLIEDLLDIRVLLCDLRENRTLRKSSVRTVNYPNGKTYHLLDDYWHQ